MSTPGNTPAVNAELDRLRAANQNKAELISISVHELRTSLSALKWLLKMLDDQDFGPVTTEQHSVVGRASLSIERMTAIINDVLTLSHTDDSIIRYSFEPFNLVQLVDEVVFDFTGEARNKAVELLFMKPDSPVTICGDAQKLRVVVQNLIENAIKYSEKGGKVSIFLTANDATVTLEVKDGGIGIPMDEQKRIFEKFYRATNAVKKETIGSGLGLYTTKTIVEKHKGYITYQSEAGKGTTFTVVIPADATTSSARL